MLKLTFQSLISIASDSRRFYSITKNPQGSASCCPHEFNNFSTRMITGFPCAETTVLQAPARVLKPHPWMIKQQKLLCQSTLTAEAHQLGIYFNGLVDNCDRLDSSSSSQQSNQSWLDQLEEVEGFMYADDFSDDFSSFCSSSTADVSSVNDLFTTNLTDDYLETGTDTSKSIFTSKWVETELKYSMGEATITTTANTSHAPQHPKLNQHQMMRPPLATVTNDNTNSWLRFKSERQVLFPLLKVLAVNEPGTRVRLTREETSTIAFDVPHAQESSYQMFSGGVHCRRRRRSTGSDSGSGSCSRRYVHSEAKAESREQHLRSKSKQRMTHKGCSTLLYNLKKTGVEKPRTYCCDVAGCEKAYKKSSHLKSHKLTHSDEKPYRCQQPGCIMRFHRLDELRKHEKIHSVVKPYSCPICKEKFTRKDHRDLHLSRHRRTARKPGLS